MTEFTGKLGNYKIIETEDLTKTVWSEYFNESCHNLSGAYEETLHNYIHGCKVQERLNHNINFNVLDVGFGVGIGLKALMDQLASNTKSTSIVNYYSIEIDEDFLLWSLKNTFNGHKYQVLIEKSLTYYQITSAQKSINAFIFIGDGRKSLPKAFHSNLLNMVDVIFQDPFSPKKNPDLWSVEWFQFLKSISNQNVSLATYSSSISIRKSLVAAGWIIENAKGFANKKTMTKASLLGEIAPELAQQLLRSPSLEIHDK